MSDITDEIEDPRAIRSAIKTLADNLPALVAIHAACIDAGFRPEAMICAGLAEMLAVMVECDTPPGTREHDVAAAILAVTVPAELTQ